MKLIHSNVIFDEINAKEIYKKLEKHIRVCYKSEDKINENSHEKLISLIMQKQHHSVLEHCSISARIICDRGVSHEIVRHRIGAYSQESTRYCNYGKDKFGGVTFIIPSHIDMKEVEYEVLDGVSISNIDERFFLFALSVAEQHYLGLLEHGWTPQQARAVLPNATKTEIDVTYNLRQWRHFIQMRATEYAHPDMKVIADYIKLTLQRELPLIFGDL